MKNRKKNSVDLVKKEVGRRDFLKTGMAGAAAISFIGSSSQAFGQKKPEKVYKWRMQSHLGPTEPGNTVARAAFVKRVKEMSGGRIDIELFPGGALVPSKDIFSSVARNVVEIGASAASYSSGIMPVVYTTLVPMGPRSAEDCVMIWLKGWGDILRAAYDKHGVKLLTMEIVTDMPLYSTKPIKKVEDLKGMKIRSPGAPALFLEQLGASTVFLPGEEVYMALSTGTIDAATWGGFAATFPKKWYEVAKYIIHPPLIPMFQQDDIIINKNVFNNLPSDLQAIVQAAADLLMWDRRMSEAMGDNEALGKMKAAGCQIITLPEDSVAKMSEAAKAVWDNLASRSPDAYQAMKIMTDTLRSKGYTDYVIDQRSIKVKK